MMTSKISLINNWKRNLKNRKLMLKDRKRRSKRLKVRQRVLPKKS
jgi:hypothetical protein